MGIAQAVAVAFGLTFLILGYLYVVFRSGLAAQQQRENPAVPQSTVWLIAHHGVRGFLAALSLCAGTLLLIHPSPNVFFAAGVATWCYALALRMAFGFKPWVQRAMWSANVVAGVLFGIQSALHGGPIGVLGIIWSLAFSAFWLWALIRIRPA
jgi:hypothetical protein